MAKAAGLNPEKQIAEFDEQEAYDTLTVVSEVAIMVRDGRETSTNPQAVEFYARFFMTGSDA